MINASAKLTMIANVVAFNEKIACRLLLLIHPHKVIRNKFAVIEVDVAFPDIAGNSCAVAATAVPIIPNVIRAGSEHHRSSDDRQSRKVKFLHVLL